MEKTYCRDLASKNDKKVVLKGWIKNIRVLGKIAFIHLRDSTDWSQVVVKENCKDFEKLNDFTHESVLEIEGVVKENKTSKKGFEVIADKVTLISLAKTPLPIDTSEKSQTKIDKRLDYRFLDIRKREVRNIFKVRSKFYKELVDFMDSENFFAIHTPKITAMGVESGAELFEIKYFDRKAFLSQSPQIYKQMFSNGGFERVYEFGPVFRAEKSHTTRHQTEFLGFDFEMCFIKDETEIMDFIEKMLKNVLKNIQKNCKTELDELEVKINMPEKIPRLTMDEVFKIINKKGGESEHDLNAEEEKKLGDYVKKKYKSDFVFVTGYSFKKRPFYHMVDEEGVTKSFDLLWNGVEVCTGAQREHRIKTLEKQAKEKGIDLKSMKEYRDIFLYGCPPHGGAGFGLDRMTEVLLNLDNVREAILLPRDVERLRP